MELHIELSSINTSGVGTALGTMCLLILLAFIVAGAEPGVLTRIALWGVVNS